MMMKQIETFNEITRRARFIDTGPFRRRAESTADRIDGARLVWNGAGIS